MSRCGVDRTVAVLALVALATGCSDAGPPLTLHLRCPVGAAGTLLIAVVPRAGPRPVEQQVDLAAACAAGRLDLPSPADTSDLHLTLMRNDGQSAQLRAQQGADIQRDRDGLHLIVRITDSAPFLANDRL